MWLTMQSWLCLDPENVYVFPMEHNWYPNPSLRNHLPGRKMYMGVFWAIYYIFSTFILLVFWISEWLLDIFTTSSWRPSDTAQVSHLGASQRLWQCWTGLLNMELKPIEDKGVILSLMNEIFTFTELKFGSWFLWKKKKPSKPSMTITLLVLCSMKIFHSFLSFTLDRGTCYFVPKFVGYHWWV